MDNKLRLERLSKRYSASARHTPPPKGPGGPGPRGRMQHKGGKPKDMWPAIKRILSYLSADKYKLVVAFVCVFAASISSLAASYMLRPIINKFIDIGMGTPDFRGLALSLVYMAIVYIIGVVSSYTQARLMIDISQNAIYKIRDDLFKKMQKLPIRFFDKNAYGELMSRYTNDVDTIGEMLNHTIIHLFQGIITIVGTLCLMVYTNVYLSIVTLVMIPIFVRVAGAISKRSRKYFGMQQAAGCLERLC